MLKMALIVNAAADTCANALSPEGHRNSETAFVYEAIIASASQSKVIDLEPLAHPFQYVLFRLSTSSAGVCARWPQYSPLHDQKQLCRRVVLVTLRSYAG